MADNAKVAKLAKKQPHERTEQEWQSIWDARTLADVEVIKADEKRLANAQLWAAVLLIEEREETSAMQKVSNGNA